MEKLLRLMIIIAFCFALCACGNPKTTNSAEGYIGMNYKTVMEELTDAGFTNIQIIEVSDLTSDSELQDGDVSKVEIRGDSTFAEGSEFEAESLVTITYHTIKTLSIPISTSEIQEYNSIEITTLFSDAGFTNVTTEEVYDLDPDLYDVEFENEVTVNGSAHFNKGDAVVFDAEIKVICHRPYEKYTVKVVVDFVGNIFFNKYDVVVSLDGIDDTLGHGEDGTFEYRLKEGKYVLQFTNAESSSVRGEVEIDVHCDVEASYQIECKKDTVTVETVYVDNLEMLAEDEVKVLSSSSAFAYKNYKEVVKALKEWGFINIKEVPVYDIFWGITEEESIDTVTINGTEDYKRGDIYKKDVEIIVSYHLKEEDDPAKQTEASTFATDETTAPSVSGEKETEIEISETEKSYTVSYSTNDYDTAKQGNTGVFSYKNRGSYDVYWIIDFDEGYVYYFTEGNGDSTCDKVKITSGHLNDRVTITWHIDGEETSWYLHFKYVNSPSTLVVNDHFGIATEFSTANLENALELLSSKRVIEY